MATPTLIHVTGTYYLADGTPASGRVRFRVPGYLYSETTSDVVAPDDITAELVDGVLDVDVPATDDPGWSPDGWTYAVLLEINGVRTAFNLAVPVDTPGGELDLSDALPVPASEGDLYAGINHTHTGYVSDAELAAAGYVDADGLAGALQDYVTLTFLNSQDFVSYETLGEELTTALADYLPKINPLVTDSTYTVRKSGAGAIRWRSTGGAIDIEKAGGDIVESGWSGLDFSGTQTNLRRWRSDGFTYQGKIYFGDTVYSEAQLIDGSTGQAKLGAKNSLANLIIAGRRTTAGPPTTGTWDAGDTVMATDGIWECVAGGTPGTWVQRAAPLPTAGPLDHSMVGWSFDPAQVQAGTILPTAGVAHMVRVKALGPTITNILLHFTVAGSGLTAGQCFASLHTDAGALLSQSVDQAANWATGGLKTCQLAVAQAATPGAWYRVLFWFNGTTGPTLSRGVNSSSAILNAGISAAPFRYATANTGLTTTAPGTIGTQTGSATAWWVGLS